MLPTFETTQTTHIQPAINQPYSNSMDENYIAEW
jgi:hypothetical protein